jgi:hypothetical protein
MDFLMGLGRPTHLHIFYYFFKPFNIYTYMTGGIILSLKNEFNKFIITLMDKEIPEEEIKILIKAGDIIDKYRG